MKFKARLQLLFPGKRNSTKLWLEADLARARGDRAKEASIYKKLAASTPNSPDEFLYAGVAAHRLQDPVRAIELFEAGMNSYPDSGLFLDHYLRTCREQGRISAAVQFFEARGGRSADTIESLFEKCDDVLVQAGLIEHCLSHGLAPQAERRLHEILKSAWAASDLWALGDILLQHQHKDEAQLIYRHFASRSAEAADDYFYGGLAEHRLGDPQAAVRILERGVEVYPADNRLVEHYVRICCEIGALDRMMKTVIKGAYSEMQACEAIFERFADTEIQSSLIAYCLAKGYTELADRRIQDAREHFPSAPALWRLSDVLLQHRRSAEAELIYESLSRSHVSDPESVMYAALSQYRMNDAGKAVDTLEAGLDKFPGNDRLLEHYVRISSELFQIDRMARFVAPSAQSTGEVCAILFERFRDPQIQMNLIEYCLHKGPASLGEKRLREIQSSLKDPAILWQGGELMTNLRRRDDARKIYKQLSERELEVAADYLFAGLAYLRLENNERCLQMLEEGLTRFPETSNFTPLYFQACATLKELEFQLDSEQFEKLEERFLSFVKRVPPRSAQAKILVLMSGYIGNNPVFAERLFGILLNAPITAEGNERAEKQVLHMLHDLTPPMIPHFSLDSNEVLRNFSQNAESLAESSIELVDPIADMTVNWMPWQSIFCWAAPELYGPAMAALEKLAFKAWPKLNFIAPHVARDRCPVTPNKKIRVGFNVHDSMPMMSGFLPRLDKSKFETVFLRPGKQGNSQTAKSWVERADETIEYSDIDVYSAIDTIARLELDIIISGPSAAASFFPMMARLASLQMVLLEPNWTNGLTHADYYISWRHAEPADPERYYRTALAFFRHPPYWIERPTPDAQWPITNSLRTEVRKRLLDCGPETRIYLCANTPPKIHPDMDEFLLDLLQRDPSARLIFLRGDFPAVRALKLRLRERLGEHFDRVRFIPTLSKDDAHLLLQSIDCCLDSYPLCGMSSSFDGAMLGVPIVTLPSTIPFGRWTAAIYEYIGVAGLTAQDRSDYVDIAIKLASDAAWRGQKSAEIREKSARYVESEASSAELEEFLVESWERKLAGMPPAHWMEGGWQQ